MTGADSNSDAVPMRPPGPPDRAWSHPSEVGLAVRGDSDRRRSSIIATGVVLGGLGLLLSGVLLGSSGEPPQVSAESEPTERIGRSVASVMVVSDGDTSVASGLVVDDEGHVLVPTVALAHAEEIWARCGENDAAPAAVVGSDDIGDMTLLRLSEPAGAPTTAVLREPSSELPVLLAHAVEDGAVTTEATLSPAVRLTGGAFHLSAHQAVVSAGLAEDDHPHTGRYVFDRSGRLLGMTAPDPTGRDRAAPVLRPAAELMAAARRLLSSGG